MVESFKKYDKVTFTALMISPPKSQWDQIQTIRKLNDRAYDRWMPHINICFPFLDPSYFDSFITKMTPILQDIDSFQISYPALNYFTHAKQYLLFAEPTNMEGITQIYEAIKKQYPILNDAEQKGNGVFHPHMTLGQFKKNNKFEQTFQKMSNEWKEISFLCDRVYIIQRDKDTPFEIKHELLIGKQPIKDEKSENQ